MTASRRKWYGLALLLLVQFMVVLDIAIVNVALPSIKLDLGFSQENLQWVISAYALFFGGFLLLGGRAADLLGRRRMFLVGVVLFTTASLVSGLRLGRRASDRRARPAGARRGDHHACGALHPHDDLRRGEGTERGTRRLGRRRRVRSRRRRPARRRPHRPPELELDLLRQRARRHPRARARPLPDQREPRRDRRELRRARRRPRHERPRDAGLRHHAGQPLRLGLGHDDRPLRRRRRTHRGVPGLGGPSQGSVDAVLDLPAAHARRREHRRVHPGDGPVRDVPDAHPLHAAGARATRP